MSSIESKRITELETTVTELKTTIADLLLCVKQLEAIVAQQSHAATPTPTPISTPTQIPAKRATRKPISAPYTFKQKHTALLHAKPVFKGNLPKSKDNHILYNVNLPRPNGAEVVHRKFIQTLHAAGVSKEEICQRTMDEFPDLCTGGSDKMRAARVWNEVEMNTSRWAEKSI